MTDLFRSLGQIEDQRILNRGEMHRFAPEGHFVARAPHHQLPNAEDLLRSLVGKVWGEVGASPGPPRGDRPGLGGGARSCRAGEDSRGLLEVLFCGLPLDGPLHAGEQLFGRTGFEQVVIGSGAQGPDAGLQGAVACQENDRGTGGHPPGRGEHFDTIHAPHDHIGQDDLKGLLFEEAQGGFSAGRLRDLVASILQPIGELCSCFVVVFDNQNVWFHTLFLLVYQGFARQFKRRSRALLTVLLLRPIIQSKQGKWMKR
jgi:hypothetical protein